jgi:hypothetical protein
MESEVELAHCCFNLQVLTHRPTRVWHRLAPIKNMPTVRHHLLMLPTAPPLLKGKYIRWPTFSQVNHHNIRTQLLARFLWPKKLKGNPQLEASVSKIYCYPGRKGDKIMDEGFFGNLVAPLLTMRI